MFTKFSFKLLIVSAIFSVAHLNFAADQMPTVEELRWMTGHWEGTASHGGIIEENWIEPADGTIASLARLRNNGVVEIMEMILIEEQDDTLVMRLQQWHPGFVSSMSGPQTFRLVEIGRGYVRFEALDQGPLEAIAYSRPDNHQFVIDFRNDKGSFTVTLNGKGLK